MASVHCHIHYDSHNPLFSLVQVYASELVNSISVFFFFPPQPKWTLLLNYRERQKGCGGVDKTVFECENKQ